MSSLVGVRRYARPASVDRIFVAQAVSSRLLAGWHRYIRWRPGEVCDTRTPYGPPMSSDEIIAGLSGLVVCSRLHIGFEFSASPSLWRLSVFTSVAITFRMPAFTAARTSNPLSAVISGFLAAA